MNLQTQTPPSFGAPETRRAQLRRGIRELVASRELINNLVARDLKVKYRGTLLGMVWSLMTPLLQVALYSLVFTVLFKIGSTDRYPFAVRFFTGLVIWNLFLNTVNAAVTSVTGGAYLLKKLYFPRAILPLTAELSAGITFVFEFCVLLVACVLYRAWPNVYWLLIPVCLVVVCAFAYGLALLLSAAQVFFRDIAHFLGIFLQLWFWSSPVLYTIKDPQFQGREIVTGLLLLNPVAAPISNFRSAILYSRMDVPWIWMGYSALMAILVLILGGSVFHRTKRLFPELV